MDMDVMRELIHNAALLMALGIVNEFSYHMPQKLYKLSQVVSGLLIGVIGVAIMTVPFTLTDGIVFDTRSILLGSAALTFGTLPSVIAAAITTAYRIWTGGAGMYMGVAVILSSTAIGLAWRKWMLHRKIMHRQLNVYLCGVAIHAVMLACTMLLPGSSALVTFQAIALPVMLIYPFGTVALSVILLGQKERNDMMGEIIEARGWYKSLFDNNHAAMMILEPGSGKIVDCNSAACRFYGWTVQKMKTMKMGEINTLPEDIIKLRMREAQEQKRNCFYFQHRKASGEIADVEVYSGPITFKDKTLLYSIIHDVSQRVAAERALEESENRFRSLVDNAPEAIYIRVGEKFAYVNKETMKLYGAKEEGQLLGTSVFDRYHPDCMEVVQGRIQATDRGEDTPPMEQVHLRLDGTPVHAEATAVRVEYQGRRASVVFVRDITERAAAERALKASEDRFRSLVDNAPDAIYIRNDDTLLYVNKAAVSLYGAKDKEQLLQKPASDRYHPDYVSVINSRHDYYSENAMSLPPVAIKHLKMNGSPVDVEATGLPIEYEGQRSMVVFLRDITERKQIEAAKLDMEAQLRQQQKLEAIGTLASGVAHEINNPINGIMNYAQLIMDAQPSGSESGKFANEIIRETERVSQIVKNLLQFSRQEKQSHSYASIYDIINRTVSLINTLIRKDAIALKIDLQEELPNIKCRSQQIEQVLMNLLTNARDALNDKYPGSHRDKIIQLSCSQYQKDDRRWVRITVEDHGSGIPEELREKIFEPFFSTKPRDKGTGLGLSISFGIVKDHHGTMWIETREGEYTRFHVDLPVDNGWEI